MSCSRTQRSEAREARTRGPSVSIQALYHCAPMRARQCIFVYFFVCLSFVFSVCLFVVVVLFVCFFFGGGGGG